MFRTGLFLLLVVVVSSKHSVKRAGRTPMSNGDFVGCPYNNDFYYNGTISSPLWPAKYPPNDKCYYYMTAAMGHVLSFTFTHFDLETCCDYVTIYDGAGQTSKILARFGGPNMTSPAPTGTYYTTSRFALMTFTSDKEIEQSGFQVNYQSAFSATPCNRDILLVINGLSTVGSQANFVKQLNFLANNLTTSWQVGPQKIRVMLNLQIDDDYAVIYTSTDMPDNKAVTAAILSLTDDVPDVLQNNVTSLNCMFRYAEDAVGLMAKKMGDRAGIERVAIVFIAQNANDDQDYFEAYESAHATKTTDDTKLIVVGMGDGLDAARLSGLSSAAAYTFTASYDNLASLIAPINQAICADAVNGCGP